MPGGDKMRFLSDLEQLKKKINAYMNIGVMNKDITEE